jgi:tyrosyl-tRNA synthetase
MKEAVRRQLEIIESGTEEILPADALAGKIERSLAEGEPLRVKMGFDPSAPDIHLGHAVGLRKLRVFQDLGHLVVLIVGDYTGMVGDPTGRNETRPRLTLEQVQENARTYLDQLFKILDPDRTEVRWNGEWFSRMSFTEIMALAARVTVARMLERDDFKKRYGEGRPISIHEFFYPLMQGYDSVVVKADVELGGTEQKFNLLLGRSLQEDEGLEPQVIITVPILEGLDGVQRMSKSLGNYVGIDEAPREMFGKIMSIPDALIQRYYTLATDALPEELRRIGERLAEEGTNPRDVKVELALRIVSMYHSPEEAARAEAEFVRVFSSKGVPDDMPTFVLQAGEEGLSLVKVLGKEGAGLVASNGEARRRIREGAVRVDGEKVRDELSLLGVRSEPYRVQVGKRVWARISVEGKR